MTYDPIWYIDAGESVEARSPLLKSGTAISINTDGTAANFLNGLGAFTTPSGGVTISAASPILVKSNTIQVNTTNATSSTYWRGDFTWVTPTTGSGETLEARSPLLKAGTVLSVRTDGTATNFLNGVGLYSIPSGLIYETRSPLLKTGTIYYLVTDGTATNFLNGAGLYSIPSGQVCEARSPLLKVGTAFSVLTSGAIGNFLNGIGTYTSVFESRSPLLSAGTILSLRTDGNTANFLNGAGVFTTPSGGSTITAGSPLLMVANTISVNTSGATSSTYWRGDFTWATPTAAPSPDSRIICVALTNANCVAPTTIACLMSGGIVVNLAANTLYSFEYNFILSSVATTTGIQMTMVGPSSPGAFVAHAEIPLTPTTTYVLSMTSYDIWTLPTDSPTPAGAKFNVEISGIIYTGAATGTFYPKIRSEVAASAVTAYTGCFGILRKLA